LTLIADKRRVLYHNRAMASILFWRQDVVFLTNSTRGAPMAVIIKTPEEIEKMRVAGRLARTCSR